MDEQVKLDSLLNDLLAKVLHPDLFDKIRMQINRANQEYREQVIKEAMGVDLVELKSLLEFYRSAGMQEAKKIYLEKITDKIKELYG